MANFSWRQWLQGKYFFRLQGKRRPRLVRQPHHVEGLEPRTMLTAPVAVDDSGYVVSEDGTLDAQISVLANDTDTVDGDTIVTATLDTNVSNGILDLHSDGTFTYTPNANFNGTDSFTYFATDNQGETSGTAATVTITVSQQNDAGTFGGDVTGTGAEDTTIPGTLTFADAIDGFTTPDFAVTTDATNGTASIVAETGAWTYTPNGNFHGTDSFTVSVTDDDGNVETQVISITVTQLNDAGTFGGDTTGAGTEDSGISGTLTFTDAIDGFTAPDFAVTTDPVNGVASIDPATGAWTYTPNANFNGTDSFIVSVTDDDGNVETQLINLTIAQANDIGTFGGDTTGSGDEDNDVTGTLTFVDAIDGFTTPDFTVSVDATNGSATIDPTSGAWVYTPNLNYFGSDSFTVSVTDDNGNVETQVITLTIAQVNIPGTFGGDTSGSGTEDGSDIVGTLTFSDPADGFTTPNFTVSVLATNGTATIDPSTGDWTYTPGANFNGTDSFTVSVTDDLGNVETQVITLTVAQVNDAGTFGGEVTGAGDEDTDISGTLTFVDAADGDSIPGFSVTGAAGNGLAVIDAVTGEWTYTPNANYHGSDSFTVSVTDDDGNVETQVINITVNSVDDPGTFGGDVSGAGTEDNAVTGTLTFTDAVEGFTTPDFTVTLDAINGVASIDAATGEWTYTPNANFNGTDSFTVSVTDDEGHVESQVINLTIAQVNDAGTFGGDVSGAADEDNDITGTLSFTDAADGFTVPDFTVAVAALNGLAVIDAATGEWTYTPNANYHGSDSFTVSVTDDDGNVETQVITLTVNAVNDAGTFGGDVSGTGDEDADLTGTLTFTDAADGFTTPDFTVTGAATNGVAIIDATTGAWSYTPNANYFGADSFTVSVTDDDGNVETFVVTLTINQVVDLNALPDNYTTSQNTLLSGDVSTNDSTTSGGGLTYSLFTDVTHGTLVFNSDGTFSYTPDNGFFGTDTFEYTVFDAAAGENQTLLVTIVVGDLTALDDSFTTLEDETLNGDVSLNDTTTSGGTLAYTVATDATHGVLALNSDGTFTYTPEANYNGSDSFTYTVSDPLSGESQTRTVSLTVTSVVDLTATNDTFVIDEDTPLMDSVATNDSTTSGGSLVYTLETDVSSGVLTFNADGSFTYNPAVNFHGTDGFSYLVTDAASGESSVRTVTITITSVNDTPVAMPTSFSTDEETPYSGTLDGTDVENDSLTFAVGTAPSHGQLVLNPDGTFTYTPDLNYHGADSFTFTVSDGNTVSSVSTVSITVDPVADDPIADPLSFQTAEDAPYSGTLTGSDGDNDQLVFSIGTTTPSHGTVEINPDGTFLYTPNANYNGSDSFTFKVNDGTTDSSEATVTITVTSVNDSPTVTDGSGTVNEDAFLNGSVSPLGSDVESDMLTYTVVVAPTHGTLVLNPDGTFVYTPHANFSGTDSFTFRANDGNSHSNDGTFAITVTAVDDPLTLNMSGGPVSVDNNNKAVRIDPAASVEDVDTQINYTNAQIRVSILSGNNAADTKHNRVSLKVLSQGNGAGQIKVKGSKIYFNGSRTPIATFTGGKKGQPLVITFTGAASQASVDAVLKQLSIQASRKASTGNRTLGIQITADGQTATATKIATIS